MPDNSWLEPLDQRIEKVLKETESIKKANAALENLYINNDKGMKKLSEIYDSSCEQDAQNIIDVYDATSEHNIAEPRALAAVLRLLIQEHQDYSEAVCGRSVISCSDLWEIISKLEQKD
jgi:hypothetical protein